MPFVLPFLVFGTLWAWLALAIPFIFLVAFVANRESGWAFFTVFIALAYWIVSDQKVVIPWVLHNPERLGLYIVGYVLIGIAWGFVKWFFHALRASDRYKEYRAAWIRENGEIDDTPWNSKVSNTTKRQRFVQDVKSRDLEQPLAIDNKGRIIFWMSYWSASMVESALYDLLVRLWDFIYARIGHVLDGISKALFAQQHADFAEKPIVVPAEATQDVTPVADKEF